MQKIKKCLVCGKKFVKIQKQNGKCCSSFCARLHKKGLLLEIPKDETICWFCKNAMGKCSWSKERIPVQGWVAIPTYIAEDNIKSYNVRGCPQYRIG